MYKLIQNLGPELRPGDLKNVNLQKKNKCTNSKTEQALQQTKQWCDCFQITEEEGTPSNLRTVFLQTISRRILTKL